MGTTTPAIAISDLIKIQAWSSDWTMMKLTPGLKTKAWRLGPSTPGGPYIPPRDTWIDQGGTAFTEDKSKTYVVCTWKQNSLGAGEWDCVGTCSNGKTPIPAAPDESMPEGLQIIIEC